MLPYRRETILIICVNMLISVKNWDFYNSVLKPENGSLALNYCQMIYIVFVLLIFSFWMASKCSINLLFSPFLLPSVSNLNFLQKNSEVHCIAK